MAPITPPSSDEPCSGTRTGPHINDAAPAVTSTAALTAAPPRQVDVIQDLVRFRRMLPDAFDVFRTKYLAGGATERRALEVLELRIPALKGHVDSMRQLLREAISLERTPEWRGVGEDATLARLLPEAVLTAEAGAQIDVFVRRQDGSTVTVAVRERFRIAAVVDALCARDGDWARQDNAVQALQQAKLALERINRAGYSNAFNVAQANLEQANAALKLQVLERSRTRCV